MILHLLAEVIDADDLEEQRLGTRKGREDTQAVEVRDGVNQLKMG